MPSQAPVPAPYVAGTINLAAQNTVYNLLALIQAQLDATVSGGASTVTVQTDASGPVFFGVNTTLGGALTSTNYGFTLPAGGSANTYARAHFSASSPLAFVQVLSTSNNCKLHVEVIS